VKYTWIDRNKTQWPIALACEVLGVSASGYFQHQRRKKSAAVNNVTGLKRLSDASLLVQIRTIHAEVRHEYDLRTGLRNSIAYNFLELAPRVTSISRKLSRQVN